MNKTTIDARLAKLEQRNEPGRLVIDRVIIGDAPVAGLVITIGGAWSPTHDKQNPVKPT